MGFIDKVKSTFTKKQVENIIQNPTTSTDEKDILDIISKWSGSQSAEVKQAIGTDGDRNYSYFVGTYSRDKQNLRIGKSQVVDNRIFSSIKAVVPFVTSKPPEPVVYPKKYDIDGEKTEEAKKIALYTQEIIKKIYKDSHIQELNESNTINRYIYKIGILRYGIKDKKIFTRLVHPKDVIFDTGAKSFRDMEYIGEKIRIPVDELIERYPDKKDIFLRKAQGKTDIRIEIIEYWTDTTVIVVMDKELIEVKDNPFMNNGNEKLKYYQNAPKPFVALNVFNTGKSITDDISEIDLTFKLQDALNDLLRQILDNARFNGNPVTVGLGLSGDQLSQIKNLEPGDAIVLPAGGDDQVDLKYLQAVPLPEYIIKMYEDMKGEIDAIFGTQATFRGEFDGVQSGVSRDILRQQAANSLAQLSRGIERMMDTLYKGWLHLILTFADDPEFVETQIKPILGGSTDDFISLIMNNDDGIEVTVQAGTMLPDDKVTESEQAMELAKMNRITNSLLYEKLGIENPKEEAEKLDLEATTIALKGQELQKEAQAKEQEAQTGQNEVASIEQEIANLGNEGGEAPEQQNVPQGTTQQ